MRKKSFESVLYSALGVGVMAAIVIVLNLIGSLAHRRIDLTKEKAFTLSEGTRSILAKLDTPVKVRFYCTQSDTATPYSLALKSYAKTVEDLLAEYQLAAHGKLIVEKYDPQPDSDAEDSARLDGVEEQSLPTNERFYLGLAVNVLDSRQVIPFLSPSRERQLEYDMSRAISRAVTPDRPVVGVMSSLPVWGAPANPMIQQMGQRGQEPWALITSLKNDFTVNRVELDADRIDDDIKVLLVIHPTGISDRAQFAIDQFVLRGGKLIAFLDPQSVVESRDRNPMAGGAMPGGSSLERLLKAWGLEFDSGKVVADRTFKLTVGEEGDVSKARPVWLTLTQDGINADDVTTALLDNIWYFAGGAFIGTPAPGLQETVLLNSTKDSQLVEGMIASFGPDSILKDFKASGTNYALAVRLTGKFKTAFPDGAPEAKKDDEANAADKKAEVKPADKKPDSSLKESKEDNVVILVGDSDMLFDQIAMEQVRTPFGTFLQPRNGNLSFAQSAVEQLAGDSSLIAVRSRAAINRPFTRVKAIEAAAEDKYMAQVKELEESRDQTVSRLNELQQQKNQNQRYVMSPEQQAEIDNLRKKEGEIGKHLRQVDKDLRHDVVALQRRIRALNIAAVPAAVCLAGIVLAVYKRKRTSAR